MMTTRCGKGWLRLLPISATARLPRPMDVLADYRAFSKLASIRLSRPGWGERQPRMSDPGKHVFGEFAHVAGEIWLCP
jgi:hypothetical protein